MKLLLVEDEVMLSKFLAKGLRKLGYAVDCAYDGEEALDMYEINDYDLMILDLNLPKKDGMEVLETIRKKNGEFRILVLSARNAVEDKIAGLDLGCNDYLTKPFDFAELEARIRSLLRREFRVRDVKLRCGSLTLDTAAKAVYVRDEEVALTKKEYALLEYLLNHMGNVVSTEELIEHVWDSDADLFSNSFKFHIHSLKKKLDGAGGAGKYIVNQRGLGYKIAEVQEEKE
ncbi:response regulator transcription factor [Murimonas intestini]|uniref:response regulator transcription factor n=1 Tax=Murimonas intestini TaxID=1337051 RepID=UPI0011DDC46E|nr:response regulator transcription factor [Murimonas intestini]